MKPGVRIRQLRKTQKMTLRELAQRVGSDVGNLSRLERGGQGYRDVMLEKIAAALSVSISGLFSTEISDNTPAPPGVPPSATQEVYRVDAVDLPTRTGRHPPARDVVQVVHAVEYVRSEAMMIFNNKPASVVRLINVRGDSMAGTLDPGDLIFVDTSIDFFEGDGIYLFNYQDDIFVKRLQKVKSQLYVISDNPRYKAWTISADERPGLHVTGRVMLSQSQQFRCHARLK